MVSGYCNRLLRIDLTHGRCTVAPLPDEAMLRKYVGGVALGMKLLLDETFPGQQATDPDAPLIMLTGPLAGTAAPGSSDLTIVTLNFNIPYGAATGQSTGFWAAYLRHAGYDGVVVTGRAKNPVFLWIDDEKVAIRDASALWGLDTRETDRLIRRSLYDQSKISVACIGPAGEAMLPGASIRNDRNHGVHAGGVGAVMGSKRLKAIAVRGSTRVKLKSRGKFDRIVHAWSEAIQLHRAAAGIMIAQTGRSVSDAASEATRQPAGQNPGARAWEHPCSPRFLEVAVSSWTVVPKSSYNCDIACAYDCHVNEGEFAGHTACVGSDATSLVGAATPVGIEDPSAAIVLADYFAALGFDASVAGALLGMAFDLFNRGLLSRADTDGLDLTRGNFDAARELLDQMIEDRGFGGRVLARGLREVARIPVQPVDSGIGDTRFDNIKERGWHGVWNVLMAQVFTGASACWQAARIDARAIECHPGCQETMPLLDPECEAEALAKAQREKLWEDCLGVCRIASGGVKGAMDYATEALGHATGWQDFTTDEAFRVGERVAVLQQLVAIRRGLTRADESDLLERLLSASTFGKPAGHAIRQHWHRLVTGYYQCMDWDVETGMPSPQALARLGLEELWRSHAASSAHVSFAGVYGDGATHNRGARKFNIRMVKVPCPNCGRVFAPLLSPYTRKIDRPGMPAVGKAACATFRSNCRRCGSIFDFDFDASSEEATQRQCIFPRAAN